MLTYGTVRIYIVVDRRSNVYPNEQICHFIYAFDVK
jgi:hypothetical protein